MTTAEPLRIGVLGAARISELSLVGPARAGGHRLVAVAARSRGRADAFAAEHGVERVLDSYADVIADPDVEVVYNPLANSLHGPWNLAALAAGKHVLTEKPSASNAEEAAEVRDAAAKAGTVFMEGFHYLFHPVTRRLHELLDSGELGELRHVETMMAMPPPPGPDPRWSLPLAGGALMDLGCYSLHAQATLAPWAGGPPRLVTARGGARHGAPEVDEWLDADLVFPGGATGSARCHMAHEEWRMSFTVIGSRGAATAMNFVQPHLDDRVVVRTPAGERTELLGRRSSYTYQLDAYAAHLRHGTPLPLDAEDALTTMSLIDTCYRAAGFPPRPRTALPLPG
ncbi:Gfo/Idh/MocA family protein [Streptomyces rapamycinicus]|uniref:Oxidoreductase n=2 Tax=Streptomyces rapamycinicus TaxID=1226757 RepID=A0A0A0N8Z2_STRRN|nr:Gfo/Idh/MocA family oxidoreductase [Streptomyces rapamycinicus]AGP52533.1 oxidoreductase [Streptomyces rapamycinicus NRRL 5491]MBB4780002.1 putative dehydrogenase [Streptomyces rapamycinicus]RLV75343.1 oxidoreductase [Streptomyces rapamycinicus NRRL 5491]UTP28709.1 Gfo/Idh/MocA family oxidoreductase [Streptomyces rapamycinicus NRRL 5491]